MKKILFVFALFSLAVFPLATHGAQFVSAKDGNYSLNANDVVSQNLYIGATNVSISGKAQNDLFATGVNVIITGEVGQDIAVAGGMVSVSGKIGEDARIAGGSVTVDGDIGGDLLTAGGTIDLLANLKVEKSAMLFAGDITQAGIINGPATIYSKKTYINGTINGDLNIKGQEVTLGPDALVKGNFIYSAAQEATIMTGAQILGEKHFTKIEAPQISPATGMALLGFMSAWWLLKLFILLVACFCASLGPVVWVVISELFPNRLRSKGMSVAIVALWIACTIVSVAFPIMLEKLSGGITFLIFAVICLANLLYVWQYVPETKGKTLEELEHQFSK